MIVVLYCCDFYNTNFLCNVFYNGFVIFYKLYNFTNVIRYFVRKRYYLCEQKNVVVKIFMCLIDDIIDSDVCTIQMFQNR